MSRQDAQKRLVILWFVLPLVPALLLTAQSIVGKYDDDSSEAWNWLLAQVTPILALTMASAFSAPSQAWKQKPADMFRWRCALATSLLHWAAILTLLLLEPVVQATPYQLFSVSGWLLTLLQGVVVACIASVIFDGR